jgi:transcriptional regulator with XRE-family HTH domain
MSLGQKIKKLRKESYLTQEQLAEKLNVTFQAVSKWENETGMPDISQIVPLIKIFGITTDELFGIQSDESAKKESCVHIIRRIVDLAQITRRKGLLSLELELPEEQNFFLKTAIRLAVDSIHPDKIEKILQNLISAGNYSDVELLERQIILQGVKAIVNGENPYQIAVGLSSVLGEEYLSRIDELIKPFNETDKYKPYVDLMESFKGKEALPESAAFEEKISGLWRFNIYIIFAEIISNPNANLTEQYFARALYGCSIGLINNVLSNLSWNRAMYLCEELLRIHSSEESADSSSLIAQNHVLEAIEQLEKQGKLVQ